MIGSCTLKRKGRSSACDRARLCARSELVGATATVSHRVPLGLQTCIHSRYIIQDPHFLILTIAVRVCNSRARGLECLSVT